MPYLGNKLYAVIHIVSDTMATMSSYPAGRWMVDGHFYDTKERAEEQALKYNRARWIKDDKEQLYIVESYYELEFNNYPKPYPKSK